MVTDGDGNVWLTPQEAANKLGLSRDRIYHIKDRLTHKKGDSRIFFLDRTLVDDYMET